LSQAWSDRSIEFDLPLEVRALIARIKGQLVAPARDTLSKAGAARDTALQSAAQKLAVAQAEFDDKCAKHRVRAAEVTTEATKASAELRVALDSVEKWREVSELEPPPPVVRSPANAISGIPNAEITALRERIKEIVARKKPAYVPHSASARWFVAIGSLIAAIQFAPLVLLWPIAIYLAQWQWYSASVEVLSEVLGQGDELLSALGAARSDADAEADRQVRALEQAMMVTARSEAKQAEQQAHQQFERERAELQAQAKRQAAQFTREVDEIWQRAGCSGADWSSPAWQVWQPDGSPQFSGRIGAFHLDVADIQPLLPEVVLSFRLPALVPFVEGRCLLLNAAGPFQPIASEALQSVLLRVLASTAPGKARFTFVDPVGLGQNVADFLQLADYGKELISGKAWTEPRHVNEQLAELTEHMETVIQKYLRREFSSILDYNQHANEVAEPFRFLVVFDFPVNFTDESARRLVSIVRNGARCGVFTFILRDTTKTLPHGFNLDDLEGAAQVIAWEGGRTRWKDDVLGSGVTLIADKMSAAESMAKRIISVSGDHAAKSLRVEVPFEKVLEIAGLNSKPLWTASTATGLNVPLGPTGARRLQYLSLGDGLAHHVLMVGRTGSGKTNLMHVMITALALTYSPDELQMYLVDFKGGVGFKPYATERLPHAAVIAIESEREFGLSVLNGLQANLLERFELFKKAGVDNLADYRALGTQRTMPRILLIVDEYQEFFSREDALAQQAKSILDQVARQGRSFGIHILLATQSLSGTAQLQTSTLGQIAVRIALPCNDTDARLIFGDSNSAARSLSRPGEAIYNAAGGLVEGNNPFQVAMMSDGDLPRSLQRIAAMQRTERRVPIVFEGNEPATLETSRPFTTLADKKRWPLAKFARAWLGEPVAMLPPIEAIFDLKPGRHLLVVDREEVQGLGVLQAAWLSLLAQHRPTTARFLLMDMSTAEPEWANRGAEFGRRFDHQIDAVNRRELPGVLSELVQLIKGREDFHAASTPSPAYLIVQGLQRVRDLRDAEDGGYYRSPAESPSPASMFATILKEGPEAHVHVLAWCDTAGNATRAAGPQMREFGLRVAAPMSEDDSRRLLDSSEAARLTKAHRMVFLDDEKPGIIQKFRPYAMPTLEWVAELAADQRSWQEEERT
jgi:DNA segregation ATPase FtsK/SpoIIIE, S-DNA-T family